MLVAVYGTLRAGHGNHYLLESSEFVGEDVVKGWDMYFACDWYPCAVRSASGSIYVEVYEVDKNTMLLLDKLEGYPHHYDKASVSTVYGTAYMYFYHDLPRGASKIEDGVWK